MHTALDKLRSTDFSDAIVHVWAFKKSTREKASIFTGRWIDTTPKLDSNLRAAVSSAAAQLTETREYGILEQNNEASALTLNADETHAPLIAELVAEPTLKLKVTNVKQVRNAAFYVVRLAVGEHVVCAVRKTDTSWRTRKSAGAISVFFEDAQLEVDDRPRFELSGNFDFFIVDETLLIQRKGAFESVLNFKAAHLEHFDELQAEGNFADLFSEMENLENYVKSSKMQLRRAAAIRQKANYKNPDFMNRLRAEAKNLGFSFDFDTHGRIIPTPDNCADIFKALLDHRLDSRLSQRLYDVENTQAVSL